MSYRKLHEGKVLMP